MKRLIQSTGLIVLLLLLFIPAIVSAQLPLQIKGIVSDKKSNTVIANANVILKTENNQILTYGFTNLKGAYLLSHALLISKTYILTISHLGYTTAEKKFQLIERDSLIIFDFTLSASVKQLQEIIIENKEPIKIKKDTVEFKADSFRRPQTRKVEDLIKGIEGFKVEADGRITYRGKEVKALLLDGDDLTQDQYQLLTRNLNADMVDKLQVIDNYNKNRIMGGLLESNEAAINLKLKKGLQGKFNGSIAAAASPEGRYEGDASLVWLKAKFKMVYLLNTNTIAKDATGLLRYQEFGTEVGMRQQEELTKKIMNGPGIITAGTVAAPDITREYVLDNHNYFTSPLFHTRISKHIKLAARAYGVSDALFFNGGSNSTTVTNQAVWSLANSQESTRRRKNISAAAELSHDNLKRFAGNLNLQWGFVEDRNIFNNKTTGFFTDSLLEIARTNRKGYAAAYNGALRLNEYNVLNITSNFSYMPEQKDFNIQTNRLYLFYNIAGRFQNFTQNTTTRLTQWQNNAAVFRKKNKLTIKFGFENNWQELFIQNRVTGKDSLLTSNRRPVSFFENKLQASTARQLTAKSSLKISINGGAGTIVNPTIHSGKTTYGLWKVTTGYTYKIKAFSGLNFLLSAARQLPDILLFHPIEIISANASVLNGASAIVPVEKYSGNISFSNFKIISKFSLLASLYGRYSKTDYVSNLLLLPQYNISTYGRVFNNRQAGASFDIGSYVFPVHSTMRLSTNYNYSINNQLLNNNTVQNTSHFANFTATWVPNFKKLPFTWQVDFSKHFFYNEQFNDNQLIKNNNQTTNLLFKLRSDFKGNYYIGTQYNYLQLSPQQQFHLWSVFQNLVISKKWNADFIVHNVLNNRTYIQRMNTFNSVSENVFAGVGRYFLVRLSWSF